MNPFVTYLSNIVKGVRTLLQGMSVTNHYFFTPREIITQRYPENRDTLKMFDRFKGEVTMTHDENNQHGCNGCGICENNCPNGSIQVISKREPNAEGKPVRVIDKHIYHLSMCTFCGLCVKNCPSNALAFGQGFEHAVYDRSKLTKVLNKPGSSLKKDVK